MCKRSNKVETSLTTEYHDITDIMVDDNYYVAIASCLVCDWGHVAHTVGWFLIASFIHIRN